MLSQAGRVVLIKATLQSLPVFYMSTTRIPTRVLNSLESLMRRFFWGKQNQDQYLAYVAWEHLCRPVQEGGLGIKDLKFFNEAILLKYLWRLASGDNSLWVTLVRTKYIPRSLLWQSGRTYRCTIFWRSLMHLMEKLKPLLKWKLAGGGQCLAIGEPWFEGAMEIVPPSMSYRNLLVKDFIDEHTGLWNTQLIFDFFGYANCMNFLQTVSVPSQQVEFDILICTMSSNGGFRVKDAYNHLSAEGAAQTMGNRELWHWVWKKGDTSKGSPLYVEANKKASTIKGHAGYKGNTHRSNLCNMPGKGRRHKPHGLPLYLCEGMLVQLGNRYQFSCTHSSNCRSLSHDD